jgi:purine-nucleoside/S-methyl-5'-thioadenosine phosphorylase / adenosine deaminase
MKLKESKLLSSINGIAHGFSDKYLGDSASQVAAMLNMKGITLLKQIHSDNVVLLSEPATETGIKEGDALVTDIKGYGIAVATADCVPILLASKDARIVAAVHAGWRGTLNEIVVNTLYVIRDRYGIEPQYLKAAIGPSIGSCCYEVGEEVGSLFSEKYADSSEYLLEKGHSKYILDLKTANKLLLSREGVYDIEVLDTCTKCSENFYSYRGDGNGTGRQLSVIGLTR